MNRPITPEQAFGYLAGELNPETMAKVQEQLDECDESTRVLAEAQQARLIWQQAAAVDLDDLTWKRIDNAVNDRIARESIHSAAVGPFYKRLGSGLRIGAWAVAGAACALTLYVTFGLDATPLPENTPPPSYASAPATPQPNVGDVLTTSTESRQVRIAAAWLDMNPAAVLRVAQKDGTGTVLELVAGRVNFDVAPRKPGRVFQVRAGDVYVTVKGTRFTVERTTDGTVHVAVEHGLVTVQRDNEVATLLAAGERSARRATATQDEPVVPAPHEPIELVNGPETTDVVAVVKTVNSRALASRSTQPKMTEKQRAVRKKMPKKTPKRTVSTAPATAPSQAATSAANPKGNAKANVAKEDSSIRVIEINVEEPSITFIEDTPDQSIARKKLRKIAKDIGQVSYESSIQALRAWRKTHTGHRLQITAKYAIGYCEFKRGNRAAARRIFATLPDNNRWIQTARDFDNPPRP